VNEGTPVCIVVREGEGWVIRLGTVAESRGPGAWVGVRDARGGKLRLCQPAAVKRSLDEAERLVESLNGALDGRAFEGV